MDSFAKNVTAMLDVGAEGATHIGLVGRGIGASLSPLMHRQEGVRQGIDYHYHLIDFDALGLADDDLGDAVDLLEKVGFTGLNVTYPFKQRIIPKLNALALDADAIGAVNTVLFADGKRIGHNTDCWGFAESFRIGLANARKHSVLQLGAGGAGSAVAHALVELGVKDLSIYDVDQARSEALAAATQREGVRVHAVSDPSAVVGETQGLVNTTPIGMDKYPGTPIDVDLIDVRHWVADIIYFPRITRLIELTRSKGCATLLGSGMAIYQAVKAFELFTGREPSPGAMTATFDTAVQSSFDRAL